MGGLSRQVRSERSDTSAAQFRPTAASSGNALKLSRIAFSFAERVFMYHGLHVFVREAVYFYDLRDFLQHRKALFSCVSVRYRKLLFGCFFCTDVPRFAQLLSHLSHRSKDVVIG